MATPSIKRGEIRSVFLNKGELIRGKSFNFKYLSDKGKRQKIVFVVSSKVSRTAVGRNKLKRRGRYIINKHKDSLPSGIVGAFIANQNSSKLNFVEMENEILEILRKIK